MEVSEMFDRLEHVLENSKIGVLSTVDEEGKPHVRWMTPVVVKGRQGCLYAVTSPKFHKVVEAAAKPDVQWMVQTKPLDEVITIRGKMGVIDNPQLKSEVLEAVGRNLEIFWRVNPDSSDLVVLETVIEELDRFMPLKGRRDHVKLERED